MKKSYVEYVVEETEKILAIDSPSGYTQKVAEYLMKEYRKLGYDPVQTVKGGVLVKLGGKKEDNAILLEAHADTLGAMVCERKGNGRLKVTPLGGMNPNNSETENCRIITKSGKIHTGTCQLVNASIHVNGEYNDTKRSWDTVEIVPDEPVSSVKDLDELGIRNGDIV